MSRIPSALMFVIATAIAVLGVSAKEPGGRVIIVEQFNASAFFGRTAPGQARSFWIGQLENEIRVVAARHKLSDDQLKEFKAAGEKDIAEWFERVAVVRTRYVDRPLEGDEPDALRNELAELRQPWTSGLFGGGSQFIGALARQKMALPNGRQLPPGALNREFDRAAVEGRIVAVGGDGFEMILDAQIAFGKEQELRIVDDLLSVNAFLGGSEAETRRQLNTLLEEELRKVDARFSLSESQKRKLRLAGRGDIKGWFDRVDELRIQYMDRPLTRQEYMAAVRTAGSLRVQAKKELFGTDSLFQKTVPNALTPTQRTELTRAERKRRMEDIDSVLGGTIPGHIDLQLSKVQREQIAGLLADRTPPAPLGQAFASVVLLHADQLRDELRPFLDDHQWNLLQEKIAAARQDEPALRFKGLWPVKVADESEPQ